MLRIGGVVYEVEGGPDGRRAVAAAPHLRPDQYVAEEAYLLILALLAAKALRLDSALAATLVFSGSFGNVVYMGFPLAERAFGEEGLFLAAGIASIHLAVMLSVGLSLAQVVSSG